MNEQIGSCIRHLCQCVLLALNRHPTTVDHFDMISSYQIDSLVQKFHIKDQMKNQIGQKDNKIVKSYLYSIRAIVHYSFMNDLSSLQHEAQYRKYEQKVRELNPTALNRCKDYGLT